MDRKEESLKVLFETARRGDAKTLGDSLHRLNIYPFTLSVVKAVLTDLLLFVGEIRDKKERAKVLESFVPMYIAGDLGETIEHLERILLGVEKLSGVRVIVKKLRGIIDLLAEPQHLAVESTSTSYRSLSPRKKRGGCTSNGGGGEGKDWDKSDDPQKKVDEDKKAGVSKEATDEFVVHGDDVISIDSNGDIKVSDYQERVRPKRDEREPDERGKILDDLLMSKDDVSSSVSIPDVDTLQVSHVTEKHISAWISEHPEGIVEPLQVSKPYTLNFKVGLPESGNLISDQDVIVPDSDVPKEGLDTEWIVTSRDMKLEPLTPDVSVTEKTGKDYRAWTARFSLVIPHRGESSVARLKIMSYAEKNAQLDIFIFVQNEIYRQFKVKLAVGGQKKIHKPILQEDLAHAPAAQLNLRTKHEWATPPNKISIAVMDTRAHVKGDAGNLYIDQPTDWHGVSGNVAGPINNVRKAAERFRAKWETYLNNVDSTILLEKLQHWQPEYNWSNLGYHNDYNAKESWEDVKISSELRDLAYYGHALYESFFPQGTDLRTWIDLLIPGSRIDFSWLPNSGPGWIPHIPWSLMYLPAPPVLGQPVDPSGFLGLRCRIGYTAHAIQAGSKALGKLGDTNVINFLHWGDSNRTIGEEAQWQRNQWKRWRNQVIVPPTQNAAGAKRILVDLIDNPQPTPMSVLYFYCQCTVGQGDEIALRFGDTAKPEDVLKQTELSTQSLVNQPLVFANACTTVAGDPYIANELERGFFNRSCRAYIGTETKVPIQFASRFALIFFSFFYRLVCPEPMAAGEAVAQTRLFLWTHFRNIGGLLYSYVNQYELFMASEQEVLEMRKVN